MMRLAIVFAACSLMASAQNIPSPQAHIPYPEVNRAQPTNPIVQQLIWQQRQAISDWNQMQFELEAQRQQQQRQSEQQQWQQQQWEQQQQWQQQWQQYRLQEQQVQHYLLDNLSQPTVQQYESDDPSDPDDD